MTPLAKIRAVIGASPEPLWISALLVAGFGCAVAMMLLAAGVLA